METEAQPRKDTFLPMKNTFRMHQHCILHDAASIQDIYPALKEASYVSMHYRLNIPSLIKIEQEMELISSRPGMMRAFNTEWRVH